MQPYCDPASLPQVLSLFGPLPLVFCVAAFPFSRIGQRKCVVAAKEKPDVSTTIIITTVITTIIIFTVALCVKHYFFGHHARVHA